MSSDYGGELRVGPRQGRDAGTGRGRSIWPTIAVIVVAAGFGGVIWYAYQHGRSVSQAGGIPLVKAEAGPVKVKPDQPGGQQIPYQDSTVYDRLGQNGQKPVAEKLLPPPETPVERPPPTVQQPTVQQSAAAAPPPSAPPTTATATPAASAASAPAADAIGGVIASIAPTKSPTPAAPVAPAVKPAAIAPTAKPASVDFYRIQVGSVRTADAVTAEWSRLSRHFPETLGKLKLFSEQVEVAGQGTFFRVRAGPLDEDGAKAACTSLKAEGVGCIVVKP